MTNRAVTKLKHKMSTASQFLMITLLSLVSTLRIRNKKITFINSRLEKSTGPCIKDYIKGSRDSLSNFKNKRMMLKERLERMKTKELRIGLAISNL